MICARKPRMKWTPMLWVRAITSADGCWHTRGRHSKNHTFSMRNYKHFSTTSTSVNVAETNWARLHCTRENPSPQKHTGQTYCLVELNKREWLLQYSGLLQTKLSQTPRSMCAGHVAKSHKNVLEGYSKMNSFSTVFSDRHKKKHPDVEHVKCHCDGRHSSTCGCLTPAFVERARNKMSQLRRWFQSKGWFRHAHDEHQGTVRLSPATSM